MRNPLIIVSLICMIVSHTPVIASHSDHDRDHDHDHSNRDRDHGNHDHDRGGFEERQNLYENNLYEENRRALQEERRYPLKHPQPPEPCCDGPAVDEEF